MDGDSTSNIGSGLAVWAGFRGKTLWDWLDLLMVPLVVGVLAAWFQFSSNNASQVREDNRAALQRESEDKRAELQRQSEEQRAQTQRAIEADRARAVVLQDYLDRASDLLIENGLRGANAPEEVRNVARARTLAALRDLDQPRKSLLMQFLRDSGLATGESPAVSFAGADMVGLDLSRVDMRSVNLREANLGGADLRSANLREANLRGVNLREADLREANLSAADLRDAVLFAADLRGVFLPRAVMAGADLSGADLREADLGGADLRDAALSGATGVTNEQLAEATSLVGATLPDGSVMTQQRWEEFKKQHRGSQ